MNAEEIVIQKPIVSLTAGIVFLLGDGKDYFCSVCLERSAERSLGVQCVSSGFCSAWFPISGPESSASSQPQGSVKVARPKKLGRAVKGRVGGGPLFPHPSTLASFLIRSSSPRATVKRRLLWAGYPPAGY